MWYRKLPEKLSFTDERKQILRNLVIDDNQPGTILHDFAVLLDILQDGKPTLTTSHQLPLNLLSEINARLKQPIQLALKRPQQKSYPHIHGLYLLMRASGLTYVDDSGKKPALVVDEGTYQQWTRLNATERYGSLLEAWLLRGYADIIGEFSAPVWAVPDNFDEIARLLAWHDLDNGLQVAGNRDVEEWLRFTPGRHNLGLLHLFGFITIQSGPPQPGEGWHIERMALTPVGGALLSLLYTEFFDKRLDVLSEFEDEGAAPFGVFQKILQPYLPEWNNNLTLPETSFRGGTHIFKVSLGPIWRRIAIRAEQPLEALASAILDSVDFDHDHLYEFSYRNRFGALERIHHPYMDEAPFASEVLIGDLPLGIGQTMTFLFDFGDNWEFDVLLEAVDPDRAVGKVGVLEEHGEAPEQYPYADYEDDEFEDYEDE